MKAALVTIDIEFIIIIKNIVSVSSFIIYLQSIISQSAISACFNQIELKYESLCVQRKGVRHVLV